jgi:hypothetical protein
MRQILAAIALLGFSDVVFAAPADESDTERTTFLLMISEGTAAIAAAAACDVDKDRIERATATQTNLIKASAAKMGYPDPEVLIKIRDEASREFARGLIVKAHPLTATRTSQRSTQGSGTANANVRLIGLLLLKPAQAHEIWTCRP